MSRNVIFVLKWITNAYRSFIEKPKRKRLLGGLKCRWILKN
jgi:hypothetical protein